MILNKQVRPDRPTGPPNLEDSYLALSLPDSVIETLFAHEEKLKEDQKNLTVAVLIL